MMVSSDARIRRTDRALNVILGVVAVLTAGSLIMGVVSMHAIRQSASDTASSRQDARLVACQSLWRLDATEAASDLQLVWAEATPITAEAIDALAAGDRARLALILDGMRSNGDAINEAADRLRDAQAEYRQALESSIREPGKFLASCDRRAG